ncbi:unnamed protein product [Linum trigynum]|uniref:Uncharacterized protein n=1 Tax=Linum trigynum TaxID=586398 RepID=A0AAV2CQJ1_9ROSI
MVETRDRGGRLAGSGEQRRRRAVWPGEVDSVEFLDPVLLAVARGRAGWSRRTTVEPGEGESAAFSGNQARCLAAVTDRQTPRCSGELEKKSSGGLRTGEEKKASSILESC